jgi:hypothetical protein
MLQLEQVRADIRKEGVDGYSIAFNADNGDQYIISINKDGFLDQWPEGFYDAYDNFLDQLLNLV